MSTEDESDTPWPNVPRTCFGPGKEGQLNACVAWVQSRPQELHGYIEGYRRAATVLFEDAVERRTSPDYVVFPLTYLWRHHVELLLKDIVGLGRVLDGKPWGFGKHGHGLLHLWSDARRCIVAHIDSSPQSSSEIANVEAMIQELHDVDRRGDGFRYPVQRDQRSQTMPDAPRYVNLRVLQEAMEALAGYLGAVRSELRRRVEFQREMDRSAQFQDDDP